jgi:hypothetical protein
VRNHGAAAVLSTVNTGTPSGGVDLFGVGFDGANRPFILISDGYASGRL